MSKPRTVADTARTPVPSPSAEATPEAAPDLPPTIAAMARAEADDAALQRLADMAQSSEWLETTLRQLTEGGAKAHTFRSASMYRYGDGPARFAVQDVRMLTWDDNGAEKRAVVLVGALTDAQYPALKKRARETFLIPTPFGVASQLLAFAKIPVPPKARAGALLVQNIEVLREPGRLPSGLLLSVECADGKPVYEDIRGGRTLRNCVASVW